MAPASAVSGCRCFICAIFLRFRVGGPDIREPRIYYGQETGDYVIVKGSTPQIPPEGKDNIYAAPDGTGGVPIGGFLQRKSVCLALR